MKLTSRQKYNRNRRRQQTLALKQEITRLTRLYEGARFDVTRLLREHVVLSCFYKADQLAEGIPCLKDRIDFQGKFLLQEANRIHHGQKEELAFALCETQKGVPLHPLMWLPNKVVEDLLRIVAEQAGKVTIGVSTYKE